MCPEEDYPESFRQIMGPISFPLIPTSKHCTRPWTNRSFSIRYPVIFTHRIQWKRIPARSPNFGGIRETGVRLAKRHLKKMTNNLTFTYEECNTILAQVEAVLNSRPIAPLVAISEEGLEALTPGHFLVGRALQSLPTHMASSNRVSSIKRWNLLQKLTEEFWQQWKADYLLHVNRYRKWLTTRENLPITLGP